MLPNKCITQWLEEMYIDFLHTYLYSDISHSIYIIISLIFFILFETLLKYGSEALYLKIYVHNIFDEVDLKRDV